MLALLLGLISGISVTLMIYALRSKWECKQLHDCACFDLGFSWAPPFEASAYLDRLEAVYLSIQETVQPVDWTITLWLGLDGLRIDLDGTTEWIRRSGSGPQSGGGDGAAGAAWDPDILALSGPLPPYRLPPPPPLCTTSVLYADNRSIEITAPCDPTMSILAQMDKLRTDMAIMSLQTQIQQTCVTPLVYPGWMQYPQTCMPQPLYPGMQYPPPINFE